jgi:CMP-N-acetylneuraminic acid synthetase
MAGTSTIALIPARAGSKGVPGKNVRELASVPLIAWSVLAALQSQLVNRVVVTTDSPDIAEVAKLFGAEVPFLRPADLAQDASPDRAYIDHALNFFRGEGAEPDFLVILRPTTPERLPRVIDEAVRLISNNPGATSLRSVHPLPEPPQKMMGLSDGWLTGLFPDDPRPEYYNLPRQSFPTAYQPNGYVDIVTARWLRSSDGGIFGPRVLGLETEVVVEIDTPEAFDLLEFKIGRQRPALLDSITEFLSARTSK